MKSEEPCKIKEGALFIADSHYPHHGDTFLHLLRRLDKGEIEVPQFFLMGDNFDLLFGYNDYIQSFSKEAIEILQRLSKKMEIHYFEGNHDFCLSKLFPDMHIYSREDQPVYFTYGKKRVGLSHGDKFEAGMLYGLYCKMLRSPVTLTLLRPFERRIIDHRMAKLSQKEICRHFKGFDKRAETITAHYADVDLVIEGHFHQGCKIGKYISLPSLACQGQIAVAKAGEIAFLDVDMKGGYGIRPYAS